ncbi:MAG TPA: exodeoxyribonuclease III [Solirubrobacteraceae bacterium]|nr:exodeoxyribonuclease III [Solirubrobacteraceae bacterium]
MRIVTWNVNSLRARLPRVLALLEEHRPDVVCLQETKCAADGFPVAELAAAGYTSVHHSGGRWSGVALLAHAGINVSDPVLGLAGDPVPDEARWCEAVVSGIRFVSVYAPNGRALDSPEFPRKLAFLDAAVARVGQLAAEPLVVAGDMNIAPADIDVYDPAAFTESTHVTAQERSRLQELLACGLVDAYRHLHPTEVQYTWWDYRAGNFHKGLGLRIDLALVSAGLADRLLHCGIDRDYRKGKKPSDHAPLLVDLSGAAH